MDSPEGRVWSLDILFYPVHPCLVPYVEHVWTVESEGYRTEDIRTIVPNGRVKIVFPYRGSLFHGAPGQPLSVTPQNTLWLLGPSNRPSIVDADGPFGVLSLEFRRGAAYRLFRPPMSELVNRVVPLPDIEGARGVLLQERLVEAKRNRERVDLLQAFLCQSLAGLVPADPILDHAVSFIHRRGGLATVEEVAKRLGYSSRYVAKKFERHVGLGTKTFSEVVRFQNRFLAAPEPEGYFDQSHAIREFRRFTGWSPGRYDQATNEFLNRFQRLCSDFSNRRDRSPG